MSASATQGGHNYQRPVITPVRNSSFVTFRPRPFLGVAVVAGASPRCAIGFGCSCSCCVPSRRHTLTHVAALPAVRRRLTCERRSTAAAAAMTTTSHLVCLFCVTAGQNGENLGSDEEQIVLFVYLLYDVANNKVRLGRWNAYFCAKWGVLCMWIALKRPYFHFGNNSSRVVWLILLLFFRQNVHELFGNSCEVWKIILGEECNKGTVPVLNNDDSQCMAP